MQWRMMMMMSGHLRWGKEEEEGWRKGPWTAEEDRLLIEYVRVHGEGRWNSVARLAGLKRNGKSCRLRWVNYLRPDLKRGQITPHEESIILELHARWGNRWSTIARSLPGRTDNEIKNYWRTHFKKKAKVPSDGNEKPNTRLLRKHQYQQQHRELLQQQQLQRQQQQQLQLNQLDMKSISILLDETDHRIAPINGSQPQIKQDFSSRINSINPHMTDHDQPGGLLFSTLNSSSNNIVPVPEAASSEDQLLWDGLLWNLDDFQGNFTPNCAFGKANMHNLVTPFC